MRYFLWSFISLLLVVPVWVHASLAGGESIFDATATRAGHVGVVLGILLIGAGFIAWIVNRASPWPGWLAIAAALVMVASAAITALTV